MTHWTIFYEGKKETFSSRASAEARASKLTKEGTEIRIIKSRDWDDETDITKEVTGQPPLLRMCAEEWQEQLMEVTHYTEDDYYETWEPRKVTTSPQIYRKCTSRDEKLMTE